MSTMIQKGQTVLFQGDSITDCGRSRTDCNHLGEGYPLIISALFQAMHPELTVRFINKGISGNRARDLRARWQEDCIDLKPDWVSILIGINDTWRRFDNNDPTSAEAYERDYRDILTEVREQLGARIIILEPFALATDEPKVTTWREDLDPKIQVARKLAREFDALYVPLDGLFAAASQQAAPCYWSPDGVHPSPAGAGLIAKAWLTAVRA